jgi:iron complex outermembrane receptor protein
MTNFKTAAHASISVVTLMLALAASPALADDAPAASADPAALPASDDIVVTARKRTERLLNTPVSATVLSNSDLTQQNIRNFQDLRGTVPNLELLPQESGSTSFTIRGIGQVANQVNSDAKTGLYVDEMYISRQEGNDLYFYDIASLQVLKGPQGALFGKNTTAGAVLLTTQRPTDTLSGYARLRVGSYSRIEGEGAINVPIADGLYGRLSFRTQNVDGFITHVLDDGRSGNIANRSLRGQLRLQKSRLTVDLLGEYNESRTDGGATIPIRCDDSAGYTSNYNALHTVSYCNTYPVLANRYQVYGGATLSAPTSTLVTDLARGGDAGTPGRYAGQGPYNNTRVYTFNGRLAYQLTDDLTLHSVTTYRDSRAAFYTPRNNAPNDIYAENDDTRTRQFTQELTLGGTALDGRLTFVGGFYYFNQKTSFLQDTGPDWIDPLGYVYDGSLRYESFAGFAQASFKITPKLELTLGGRYTYDRKRGSSYVFFTDNGSSFVRNGQTYYCNYNTPNPVVGYGGGANGGFNGVFIGGLAQCAGPAFTAGDSHSWQGFDPKVQLSYRWSDQLFTYISASHGYNAGGFNQQLGSQPANGRFLSYYDPEKLWSYEAGIKAELLDRRLSLNLSGFYQKYTDIQTNVNVLIGGVSTRQVQTGASAHEAGFEGDVTLRPVPDLTIRANLAYLSQAYDSVKPNAVSLTLDTPVNSAPEWSYSGAIAYTLHVSGHGGTLTPSVDVRGISSKRDCPSGATFTCKLPPYALVGFRLDFVPSEDGAWKIGVYGTNVFDKFYQLSRTGFFGGFGIDRYTAGRPQEFGGEVSLRF